MIALSPGLAQGCFDLIEIVGHHSLTFPEIRAAFGNLGGLPSSKVIETSQALGWLRANENGLVILSPTGARLASFTAYEPKLRQALLDYIDAERPPWIQNASSGRARVLSFAGSDIAQVFVEAGLAHGIEDEVVAFWDALAARARGQRGERLTLIGRQAEKLTMAYEEERTGRRPKWVSIDSNADGYDVLSIVHASDLRRLSIEVKGSTMGVAGTFHLTRNEWDRALEADAHIFHLWDVKSRDKPRLAVVPQKALEQHVPSDHGSGVWEIVEIPFAAFREQFAQLPG